MKNYPLRYGLIGLAIGSAISGWLSGDDIVKALRGYERLCEVKTVAAIGGCGVRFTDGRTDQQLQPVVGSSYLVNCEVMKPDPLSQRQLSPRKFGFASALTHTAIGAALLGGFGLFFGALIGWLRTDNW